MFVSYFPLEHLKQIIWEIKVVLIETWFNSQEIVWIFLFPYSSSFVYINIYITHNF